MIDTTGDGVANAVGSDTNGDGKIDPIDYDGDGVIDAIVPGATANVVQPPPQAAPPACGVPSPVSSREFPVRVSPARSKNVPVAQKTSHPHIKRPTHTKKRPARSKNVPVAARK